MSRRQPVKYCLSKNSDLLSGGERSEQWAFNVVRWIIFKMEFDLLIRRFKFLFNFFGLSQFDSHITESSKRKSKFTATVYMSILILLFCLFIYYRICFSSPRKFIFSLITYMNLSSELLLQFTIVGQVICFYKNLNKLRLSYDFIEKYMRNRIGYGIQFNDFQKRIFCLVMIVLVPHCGTLVLRKTLFKIQFSTAYGLILLVFYLLSSLVKLYIIIQVELLNYFLKLTTRWLQWKVQLTEFSAIDKQQMAGYTEILHLKLIHFKLWDLSMNINRIFGWSLGAIVLRNFFEMAYGSYWLYLYSIMGKLSFSTLLRKISRGISTNKICWNQYESFP